MSPSCPIRSAVTHWLCAQGATYLYLTYVHPYIQAHEAEIEDFISSGHDQLKSLGMTYLRHLWAYLQDLMGVPPQVKSPDDSIFGSHVPDRFLILGSNTATESPATPAHNFIRPSPPPKILPPTHRTLPRPSRTFYHVHLVHFQWHRYGR